MLARVAPHGITARAPGEGGRAEPARLRRPLRGPEVPDAERPHAPRRRGAGGAAEEAGFPLWLFSNSTEMAQSSQWAGDAPALTTATCHPDAAPGFSAGDVVLLESAVGRIRARLAFDTRQRKDLVVVPKGGHYDKGTCANALVKARLTDQGEGAAYQDCRVRIRGPSL